MLEQPAPEPCALGGVPAIPLGFPNWREGDSYRYLLGLDREGWAWEWLRRNRRYCDHARAMLLEHPATTSPAARLSLLPACDATDWGLHFR